MAGAKNSTLPEDDPGGWLGKTLTWGAFLCLASVVHALAPRGRPVVGSVLILGLGALAALRPYPWFRKFLTCGVRLFCSLSIAWFAVLLFELFRRGGDPARTAGAIVSSLVMAIGFWMLRKASDAQILGKMKFSRLLLFWILWALVCITAGGLLGLGIWILAGVGISVVVRWGLKLSVRMTGQAVPERAAAMLRLVAGWAAFATGTAAFACLILAAKWAPGRLFGLWDWMMGRNPIDEWIWVLGFPDPRFKPPPSGVHPIVLLANSLLYLLSCVGLGWLTYRLADFSRREASLPNEALQRTGKGRPPLNAVR